MERAEQSTQRRIPARTDTCAPVRSQLDLVHVSVSHEPIVSRPQHVTSFDPEHADRRALQAHVARLLRFPAEAGEDASVVRRLPS